jgi:hypothetical protein
MRWGQLPLAAALVLSGCSGGTDTGSGRGTGTGGTGALGTLTGTGTGQPGTKAGPGGTTTGAFGNSKAPVVQTPGQAAGTAGQPAGSGGACMDGKFCAPTGADMGCGTLTLASNVKKTTMPGNVLLIWDRSLSMNEDWNGMPRWQAAGNAVINALKPIQDLLTIGAVLFPSPNGASGMPGSCVDPTGITCAILGGNPGDLCSVGPITAADQLNFEPGPQAITDLQTKNNGAALYQPVGATPTAEAVKVADMALASAPLVGTTVAVIITDGEPNCMWDQNATVTTIGNWLSQKKIKTFVVGLAAAGMGNGPMVLNALAQAGGTMQFLTPADPMTLQTKLAEVVSQTISSGFDTCSIDVTPPTTSPDKLQLVVEEAAMQGMLENVPHDLGGTAGGWTITPDGAHVELTGGLCNSAKSGTFTKLTFQFGCKDIPPIPPAHVM